MLKLIVDKQEVTAQPGQSVLQACLAHGIYIPHLCYLENQSEPRASCRLCFIQIQGRQGPAAACATPATDGMRVITDTPEVRRLQRSALRYLLSVHDVDCRNCHANRTCALQQIARFLKVGLKAGPLHTYLKEPGLDTSHPYIDHYPNRCVLCARCIRICRDHIQMPVFTFSGRGFATVIRYYPKDTGELPECHTCGRCIAVCPVGALQRRDRDQNLARSTMAAKGAGS